VTILILSISVRQAINDQQEANGKTERLLSESRRAAIEMDTYLLYVKSQVDDLSARNILVLESINQRLADANITTKLMLEEFESKIDLFIRGNDQVLSAISDGITGVIGNKMFEATQQVDVIVETAIQSLSNASSPDQINLLNLTILVQELQSSVSDQNQQMLVLQDSIDVIHNSQDLVSSQLILMNSSIIAQLTSLNSLVIHFASFKIGTQRTAPTGQAQNLFVTSMTTSSTEATEIFSIFQGYAYIKGPAKFIMCLNLACSETWCHGAVWQGSTIAASVMAYSFDSRSETTYKLVSTEYSAQTYVVQSIQGTHYIGTAYANELIFLLI